MGEVWLAESTTLRRRVVVKLVQEAIDKDETVVARFSREAELASRVDSPNVVRMFEHGLYDGRPYIVMEHLEGEDLRRRLQRLGSLHLSFVDTIVRQLAHALTAVHAQGIVHRDIKPGNIYLCGAGGFPGDEVVKLLDFGIAKHTSQSLGDASTKTGTVLGTPFYMSPEQLAGRKPLDTRTDLWAVGVVAFEALTGVRPFVADTMGELVLHLHSMVAPPRMTDRDPRLPASLDAWFARACALKPADRFGSALELAQAFSAAARGLAPVMRASGSADLAATTVVSPPSAMGIARDVARPHVRVARPSRVVPLSIAAGIVLLSTAGGYAFKTRVPSPVAVTSASSGSERIVPLAPTSSPTGSAAEVEASAPATATAPSPRPAPVVKAHGSAKKPRPATTYEDIE
jgi:serine/threonine-protein kinase